MKARTPVRVGHGAIGFVVAASVVAVAASALAQNGDWPGALWSPAAGETVILTGAPGSVGETAFWRWAGTSGLGPRELAQAGLGPAEMLELVCQFADDIDLAISTEPGLLVDSVETLVTRAEVGRAILHRQLRARPITETPDLPEDVSARPECVLAPEPEDVAALLADAPGAAPYLIERRLRRIVRRTSTLRILTLPDVQQQRGDAP